MRSTCFAVRAPLMGSVRLRWIGYQKKQGERNYVFVVFAAGRAGAATSSATELHYIMLLDLRSLSQINRFCLFCSDLELVCICHNDTYTPF